MTPRTTKCKTMTRTSHVTKANNERKTKFFDVDLKKDLQSANAGEALDGARAGSTEAIAGVVALACDAVCAYSLYALQTTGCGVEVRT